MHALSWPGDWSLRKVAGMVRPRPLWSKGVSGTIAPMKCRRAWRGQWQRWGLRPRSYDKTGLRPASVLVLYFRSCLKHCCARQALCDMIMLKCNKHLYFPRNKCRNSAKHNWSSCHFLTFLHKVIFDNKTHVLQQKSFFVM